MADGTIEPSERTMILAHYYRAMVGRADVWRTRMDSTTHWAIGATAAIVTFALGDSSVPHHVVFISTLLTLGFLALEARRLTFYHLFQQRVLRLERGFVAPALQGTTDSAPADLALAELREALAGHLGRTAPTMPLVKAVSRRLRRIYLFLFAVQMLAWGLKLSGHPQKSVSIAELADRAHIGAIPGEVILAAAVAFSVSCIALALLKGGTDARKKAIVPDPA